MGRTGGAGQVINLIDFDIKRMHDIVMDQLEVLVSQPLFHIPLSAREEIVHYDDLVALHH